jgi:hypothetical protein
MATIFNKIMAGAFGSVSLVTETSEKKGKDGNMISQTLAYIEVPSAVIPAKGKRPASYLRVRDNEVEELFKPVSQLPADSGFMLVGMNKTFSVLQSIEVDEDGTKRPINADELKEASTAVMAMITAYEKSKPKAVSQADPYLEAKRLFVKADKFENLTKNGVNPHQIVADAIKAEIEALTSILNKSKEVSAEDYCLFLLSKEKENGQDDEGFVKLRKS